jgi:phosphomannomutase/phosphoglucomutase
MKFSVRSVKSAIVAREIGHEDERPASFRKAGLILFSASTILILLLTLFFYQLAAGHIQSVGERQIRQVTGYFANRFASLVEQYSAMMEATTRDPEIGRLLAEGNEAALHAKESALGYLFPASLGVRLLEPGTGIEDVDMEASPPVSYAVVAMLREADTRETPPPAEVHHYGTAQQQIVIIRRIPSPSGRHIVGNMMVSLALPILQQTLDGFAPADGYIELWQQGGKGQPLVVASGGNRGNKQGAPAATAAVADTRWQVAYWPDTGTGAFLRNMRKRMLIATGIATTLLALVLFLVFRMLTSALRRDQATLVGLVKDMRDDRVQRVYPVGLAELRDTIDLLTRIAGGGRNRGQVVTERERDAACEEEEQNAVEPFKADLAVENSALDLDKLILDEAKVDPAIFRAYDIRGVVRTNLTPDVVYQLGRAIGSEACECNQRTVVVGRDGRLSGPELSESLIRGLRAAGCDVKDIGCVPTPVLYFATHHLGTRSGVVVTGSHNPPDYNGMKIVIGGETFSGDSIQALRRRVESGNYVSDGKGSHEVVDVVADYIERIREDIHISRPLKVAVDCGNGVAGGVAPQLFRALGCEITELFCEVDGHFPNHHPDPSKTENLAALIKAVRENGADLGMAFDGDGDRLGIVASGGEIIWPDRVLMLLAIDVLGRNPGATIIYDVKCSRHLERIITEHGGQPLMWKTGHSLIKAKIKESGALLAGEMSGHIFFKERWFGFDDALYAAARLLEILGNDYRTSSTVFADLPDSVNTPELNVSMGEGEPQRYMERLLGVARFEGARITTIDGLRADFADGWGLVRASNTTPVLVLRFEADDQDALQRIQGEFRRVMLQVAPNLSLPF